MSIDFADSGENTVSGDMAVPAKHSTDNRPDLPDRSTLPDPSSAAPVAPVASATPNALPSVKFPVESEYIVQQIRIGRLTLTVDNAEFVHGIQCGLEYAREDLQPPRTTQELLNEFIQEHDNQCRGKGNCAYESLFGTLLGEICHLVNGTRRLDFHLGLRPPRNKR